MTYAEILDILAPCGLNCRKCMANAEGEIRYHSSRILELLGPSFGRYAERFKSFMPVFGNYPEAKALLEFFTKADCKGCRSGMCRYPSCNVMNCHKDKGVDFCFQCREFPCENPGFDPDLRQRWVEMNIRMREIGVEAFYHETTALCRYS